MFKQPFNAPDDSSGGIPNGPTLEQVQKQAQEIQRQYDELQTKITEGKLVDPATFVEQKIKAGELYPKERFTGMQTKYQETQTALTDLQNKSMEWQTNLSTLEEKVKEKETKEEETAVLVETLERRQKRAQLIFSEFPELAPFEADGLLPEAEEDKLRETFSAFSTKLGSVKENAAKEFGKGGSGPTPPKKEEQKLETAQTHLKMANQALSKGEFDTYNTEYELYLAALQKQSVS